MLKTSSSITLTNIKHNERYRRVLFLSHYGFSSTKVFMIPMIYVDQDELAKWYCKWYGTITIGRSSQGCWSKLYNSMPLNQATTLMQKAFNFQGLVDPTVNNNSTPQLDSTVHSLEIQWTPLEVQRRGMKMKCFKKFRKNLGKLT